MSSTMQDVKEKVSDAVETVKEKVLGAAPGTTSSGPSEAAQRLATKPRSIWASAVGDASGKPPRPTTSRTLVWEAPYKVAVKDMEYPDMKCPDGAIVNHGVVLRVIATNICGSDLHMYRGHIGGVKPGMPLGHEVTGEIVEMGTDVERFELGDIVSVPFNVACGRCDNCRERKTSLCQGEHVAGDLGAGAAYGFPMMGNWRGGQTEYHFVPYADFQLLKIPKDRALGKMAAGVAFLSDILPTGYNGALQAGVKTGSIVYVAGAGPVGLCAAASCFLLGAACVFISDNKPDRLALAAKIGCHTIDLNQVEGGSSDAEHIKKAIEKVLPPEKNARHLLVDASIDCVGYECTGCGRDVDKRVEEQVLNTCIEVTKAGGQIGAPGIYAVMDPSGSTSDAKQGIYHTNLGTMWNKGVQMQQGQCPVMAFNVDLLKAILYKRIDLTQLLNVKIISMDEAAEAYKTFNDGEAAKYIIDPHGILRGLQQAVSATASAASK